MRFTTKISHIGFTLQEVEALQHRLAVPDALADVFAEEEPPVDRAITEVSCDRLSAWLKRSSIIQLKELSDHDKAVLVDCVEGSTYAACASEESPQLHSARVRTLANLARKLTEAFELSELVTYPRH